MAVVSAFAMLASAPSAWAVNKCVAADGTVSFQDGQCPASSKNMTPQKAAPAAATAEPKVMSPEDMAKAFDKQLESPETQAKIKQSIERRELEQRVQASAVTADEKTCGGPPVEAPSVGMPEAKFLQCTRFARQWDAVRVNSLETQRGTQKQFVYPHFAPIKYVYVEQGHVTAISR